MVRNLAAIAAFALSLGLLGLAHATPPPETYEYVKEWGGIGSGPGEFGSDHGPMESTFDDSGYLYVADYGNNRIQKFTASGDPTTWGEFVAAWYTGWVFGLEFYDQDGYLYFTNVTGQVGKSTTTGSVLWKVSVASAYWQTHGIALDCEGHIRVCENYLGNVYELDRDGHLISTWDWPDGEVEPNAEEIASDIDGDLWIRDGSRVLEFNCQDESTGRLIDESPEYIRTVSVDDCGNIYISLLPSRRIRKYGPDLSLLAEWGEFGYGPGQFNVPRAIGVKGCGETVVVSDSQGGAPGSEGTHRIQVFRLVERDTDGDGVPDIDDNCELAPNPEQTDTDSDGWGDACDDDDDNDGIPDPEDNCVLTPNPEQSDLDGDGLGDPCDADRDGDGVLDEIDNCPEAPNEFQDDTDSDDVGDACDDDDDNDGVCDTGVAGVDCTAGPDNCSTVPNAGQADLDGDLIGDACDGDVDGDGADNDEDNCPTTWNSAQDDTDDDGDGDACDADDDDDGVPDDADNCALVANPEQADLDGDGQGDACDGDLDGDGVGNDTDNCPATPNADQHDFDGDGSGDACDTDIDGDGVGNAADVCANTPLGELIDPSSGCSIAQLCPCEGPRGTNLPWKNHGKYVSCVAHATEGFLAQDLITDDEKDAIVSEAAQSDCGAEP